MTIKRIGDRFKEDITLDTINILAKRVFYWFSQKFPENFYFTFRDVNPFTKKFPEKISAEVLTPVLKRSKTPYLRGDTGGGTPHLLVQGGVPSNFLLFPFMSTGV